MGQVSRRHGMQHNDFLPDNARSPEMAISVIGSALPAKHRCDMHLDPHEFSGVVMALMISNLTETADNVSAVPVQGADSNPAALIHFGETSGKRMSQRIMITSSSVKPGRLPSLWHPGGVEPPATQSGRGIGR